MGTAWLPRVAVRRARWRSSGVISSSPRYFSMMMSSWLETTSIELVVGLLGLGLHLGGDLLFGPLLAHAVVPDQGPHVDQVDDAPEPALGADGELDHGGDRVEAVLDHLHALVEVGAGPVHLVDEADPGDLVLVGLAPHRLGLGLHAGHGVEHGHRPVEHPQRALHLDGEVHVAGGVDDVDQRVVPHAGGGGRGDGDAPLLLLDHPVHGGRRPRGPRRSCSSCRCSRGSARWWWSCPRRYGP